MSKAPAVDYAIRIIEFFAQQNHPIGIADISNSLDINKNAVSRIIDALMQSNWIYCSDETSKKYSLTMRPFSFVSKNIQQNSVVKACDTVLSKLHDEIPDSIYMGVKHGKNVIYQLHYDSTRDVRINGCVGGEYPLHISAPGKVLLAYSDDEKINDYFKQNNALKEKFLREAIDIKEKGYSIDNEEFSKGIICYAAPVFDASNNVMAAVGVSSLTLYDTIDELIDNQGKLISKCANEISAILGYNW